MNTTFADRINLEQFITDSYWSQVVATLHDILGIERLIILDCKLGLNHVEEIATLNCNLDDINEQFYQQNSVQDIVNFKFLKPIASLEEQLLIPLFFKDELQGILLLSITQLNDNFIPTARHFTNQIGETLYYRQQLLKHKQVEISKHSLEPRLSMLENIMDYSETATILYDMFGMAVQVNQSMRALAQIFGLKPQTMPAMEFFVTVSKTSIDIAKQNFCDMFLHSTKINQQIKLSGVVERYFILDIQVFSYFDNKLELDMQQGILCQLIDVTKIKLQSTLKEQIAERLIFQFRNDMQSILTASQLLISQQTNEEERYTAASILQNKINSHIKILTQVEQQLNIQIDDNPTNIITYPIDAKESILDAMENVSLEAVKCQIRLVANLPDLVSLIFASRTELYWVVGSIFALLLKDAVPETDIVIDMIEREHWVIYTFKNTGFGIPNERLQQYLATKELEIAEQFHDVRRAINIVKIWGGTLTAESQVGIGTSFELCLRVFI
ncbi:MAG TPA: HAMP domain-containing histidine kinase [Thioploca sp.]|nr:HAMP domain-containing histidine kinase [Thioploca sp.]